MAKTKSKTEITSAASRKELLLNKYKENMLSSKDMQVGRIRTGILEFDYILGGGFGRGRLVDLYGGEGAGKTSLVLQCVRQAQIDIKECQILYIDAEVALDILYVFKLGIKVNITEKRAKALDIPDDLLYLATPEGMDIYQPDNTRPTGEETLDFITESINLNLYDYIILDSKDALLPKAEKESIETHGLAKSEMGLQAKMFSKFCRNDMARLGDTKTVLIFISQIREKLGISFGNPEITAGGRAIRFYSTTRLSLSRGSVIKNEKGDVEGRQATIKTNKHKLYPGPFKKASFPVKNNVGVDIEQDIVDKAIMYGIISRGGAWFTLGEERIQGRNSVLKYIKENNLHDTLYTQVLDKMKGD